MGMERGAFLVMAMLGTMRSKVIPNQVDQCLLFFGMLAMSLWSIVSNPEATKPQVKLTYVVYVKDPPLWTLNIMNGTNMWFDDIYNNATAVNAPYGVNWVQNTDGFDTSE